MPWSDEARLLVRPFRAYAGLAADGDERPAQTLAARVLFFLFVCGAFVSLTTAGRLVAFHVASVMAFWAFIPAVQAGAFLLALHVARATPASRSRALALYFAGHGPWMLFFLLLAGVCLFAPDVRAAITWLLRSYVLVALLLGTIAWSGVLTYACFREGLALARGRAARATAVFYAAFSATIVGYYLAMNEIQPQLPWAP
jgi:hypothetical protein